MLFSLVALLPALAAAQSATSAAALPTSAASLPTCALQCTLSTVSPDTCPNLANQTCVCTNEQFQKNVYQCYVNSCTPDEITQAENYGAALCEQNGTPINVTGAPSGITTPASVSQTQTASPSSTTSAGNDATKMIASFSLIAVAVGVFTVM